MTRYPDHESTDYGIDAPGLVRNFALAGISAFAVGIFFYYSFAEARPAQAALVAGFGVVWGACGLGAAALMVFSSKRGKLEERDRTLDSIPWRGDERVLDAGCGRGLMLIGAAKRLTSGVAVGVDTWREKDQSGNSPEAALTNARAEGVEERVEILEGDLRELPFEDESFDVILSSLVLHNINEREERAAAVRGLTRILKPGGHIVILDIWDTGEYAKSLREAGMRYVSRSKLRFSIFPPARLVTARKPGSGEV
ncbi:MAG TPA: class I SAM-dependent methyltransferase [Rubrobacteraceae bacterium]|nr:class I SAM-dependent methyltransferase [Rubrobacteraceae bacterium]